jgi:hypothetical protein
MIEKTGEEKKEGFDSLSGAKKEVTWTKSERKYLN